MRTDLERIAVVKERFRKDFMRAKGNTVTFDILWEEWDFLKEHMWQDLLPVPKSINNVSLKWYPDGVYRLYHIDGEQLYLYIDPVQVRFENLRFEFDPANKEITDIVNLRSRMPKNPDYTIQIERDAEQNLILFDDWYRPDPGLTPVPDLVTEDQYPFNTWRSYYDRKETKALRESYPAFH